MKENLKGKLVINCGGMFSGKSTELLRQGERYTFAKKKVVYLKPAFDDRYSVDEIVNHNGRRIQAINTPLNNICVDEIFEAEVILIDEIQFYDRCIIQQIKDLINKGYYVYCSGLDMDYKGNIFEITVTLMGIADEVNKLHAVCKICGEDAVYSKKINNSKKRIELGSEETYIPVCRRCFYE